jgi:hypothetical protein
VDPTKNLEEQLRIASRIVEAYENERDLNVDDCGQLAELVIALDSWITRGDYLPASWEAGRRAI